MKKKNLAILTILLILNISCKNELINKNLEIKGYSIGDSISNDFIIKNEYGEYFKDVAYIKDTLIDASTIGNHLSDFHIKQSVNNYANTINEIRKIFGCPNLSYIGDSLYGVKLNQRIEYNLWIDSLTYNKVETIIEIINARNFDICITNDSIVEKLSLRFIKEYDKKEERFTIETVE